MKAVVLEKQNTQCIVLADDESMHTIEAPRLQVGDVFDLAPYLRGRSRISRKGWQRVLAAAAVLMIALCTGFWYTTFTVSATVTTEGEAPIAYYLNHRGQVLRAEPLNDEAKALMNSMGGVDGRPPLDTVLKKTEKAMHEKGLLGEDEHLTYKRERGKVDKSAEKDFSDKENGGNSNWGGNSGADSDAQRQDKPTKATQKQKTPSKDKDKTNGEGGNPKPGKDEGQQPDSDTGQPGGDSGGNGGSDDNPGGDTGGNPGGNTPPGGDSGGGSGGSGGGSSGGSGGGNGGSGGGNSDGGNSGGNAPSGEGE